MGTLDWSRVPVMKILKEITVWDRCEYAVPNHTYALNDQGKMVAYRKEGGTWEFMSSPRFFQRTRRKFVTLKSEKSEVAAEFMRLLDAV